MSLQEAVTFNLTPAGTTAATATQIDITATDVYTSPSSSAASGVRLPPDASNGMQVAIYNNGSVPLNVWPAQPSVYSTAAGSIAGGAAGAAAVVQPGASLVLVNNSGDLGVYGSWYAKSASAAYNPAAGGAVTRLTNLTASRAILPSESGTTFLINPTSAFTATLPAVATSAGLSYRFIVTTSVANTFTVSALSTNWSGQLFFGNGSSSTVEGLNANGSTNVIFGASQAGARLSCLCTGAAWQVTDSSSTVLSGGFSVS